MCSKACNFRMIMPKIVLQYACVLITNRISVRLSVLVVRAAARPATSGLPDGIPFWPGGLGSYPIRVLLDLLDLAAPGGDGGPKRLPYGCLIAQRRKGQKYSCQTGAPADKLVPYATEEQCMHLLKYRSCDKITACTRLFLL